MRPFVPKLSLSEAFFEEAADAVQCRRFLGCRRTEATVGAGVGADLIHAALEAVSRLRNDGYDGRWSRSHHPTQYFLRLQQC